MVQTIEELQSKRKTIEIIDLFPLQGEWTEEDYFNLPETNRIVELSKGRLIITPSPTDQHQKISIKLSFLLMNYVLSNNLGEVRYSPLDVKLWKDTIRQPDIVFMSSEHMDRIFEKYWGIPDLVMEILSESTAKEDRTVKFYEYEKAGIQECWIVDPVERVIEVYVLDQGKYRLLGRWGAGDMAHSEILAGFVVRVEEVLESYTEAGYGR